MTDPIARRFLVVVLECSVIFIAGIAAIVSSITCGAPAEPYVPVTITVAFSLAFVAVVLQDHLARFLRRAILSNAIVFVLMLALMGTAGMAVSIAKSVQVISAIKTPHGLPAEAPAPAPAPARAPQAEVGKHGSIYGVPPQSQGK